MQKILTLSFVGSMPETAAELHKQIQAEIEPDATLDTVQEQLAELANDHFIHTAETSDGTAVYWRG